MDGYAILSGTSMATPYIAGVALVLMGDALSTGLALPRLIEAKFVKSWALILSSLGALDTPCQQWLHATVLRQHKFEKGPFRPSCPDGQWHD